MRRTLPVESKESRKTIRFGMISRLAVPKEVPEKGRVVR
jgi:hypothetical protein